MNKPYAVAENKTKLELTFRPLDAGRWLDFEQLFGPKGAYGGCWCMWWRCTRKQFGENQYEGNRQAMRDLVQSGIVPGILAYHQGEAVGWCSVAPREHFGSLNRSPVLKPIDDEPVWSLVCFYISPAYQNQGVATALIEAAVDYVREQGGSVLEAYPTVPAGEGKLPPVSGFMGTPAMFARAGFVECKRASKSKLIMRRTCS